MKKTLVALALQVMLLVACNNKQPVDNNYIKYREFQQMARNTITNGIMEHGTFSVLVHAYHYNPETEEVGERDDNKWESYSFIKDGHLIYYREGESSAEYILDFDNNRTLRKAGNTWSDIGENPATQFSYACYVAQINVSGNQLTGSKNGKYDSNENFINYKYKLSNGFGVVKYRCTFDKEAMLLTTINRVYHDLSTYYDVDIINISLDGEIPEH